MGAIGVALVAGVSDNQLDPQFFLGVIACLAAAICYALGGIYQVKFASHTKPMGIAVGSQIAAALVLAPLIPFAEVQGPIAPIIVVNMLALALLCSSVAYILYYKLMLELGPTKTLTVTFLIPAFGMLWGALFLGEKITFIMVAGGLLVLIGTRYVIEQR